MTDNNTTTKEAAYERLRQAQLNFRLGRISLTELNAARRAYNRIAKSDAEFDKVRAAGKVMIE